MGAGLLHCPRDGEMSALPICPTFWRLCYVLCFRRPKRNLGSQTNMLMFIIFSCCMKITLPCFMSEYIQIWEALDCWSMTINWSSRSWIQACATLHATSPVECTSHQALLSIAVLEGSHMSPSMTLQRKGKRTFCYLQPRATSGSSGGRLAESVSVN